MKCLNCDKDTLIARKYYCSEECRKAFRERFRNPDGTRTCPNCGKKFAPAVHHNNGMKYYCSDECRNEFYTKKEACKGQGRIKNGEIQMCLYCGKDITGVRKNYCSDDCRKRSALLTRLDNATDITEKQQLHAELKKYRDAEKPQTPKVRPEFYAEWQKAQTLKLIAEGRI